MEGLLALVAVFVFGGFAVGGVVVAEGLFALLALFAEAIISLIGALIGWVLSWIGGKGRRRAPEVFVESSQTAPWPKKRRRQSKSLAWVKWGALAVFALLVTVITVGNFVFFEPIARWAVASMETRTGIRTDFSSATGNFFTGRIDLRGVKMTRPAGDKGGFDITARRVKIDLDIPGILSSPSAVDSVHITGIEGRIEHRPRSRSRRSGRPSVGERIEKLRTRKSFVVRDLRLDDIRLSLTRAGAPATDIVIDRLSSQPMRSRFALFDVLFRSNATGSVAGRPFTIATRTVDGGRETKWNMDGLPVDVAARFFTAPPIGWLTEGTMDVRVIDRWRLAEAAEIDMDWRFVLRDGRATIPETVSAPIRAAARPAVNYINSREAPLDIGFTLTMKEAQFDGAASLDAAGLWRAVVEGVAAELARRKEFTAGPVSIRIERQVDRFRRFLDRNRKPPPASE